MKVISKIKTMLKPDTIKALAAVCDTRRLASNIDKMKLDMKVLVEARPDVMQIGGATNRIVVQLEGYIIKIAVDSQGYEDNLMEFSICEENQPYVTKSYETNGYILVAQTVRLPTKEEWRQRKGDILKILDELSKTHLLGDVGYDDLNRTNWGITDDNRMVILDYAYIHRATEKLFTCPECGDGILTYDQYYTTLMCSNSGHCHARYTYSEMKRIQGDKIDQQTIAERLATAIVMPGDMKEKETILTQGSTLIGDSDVVVIHNNLEYQQFMDEENGVIGIEDHQGVSEEELERREAIRSDLKKKFTDPVEFGEEYLKAIGYYAERPKRKYVLADDYYEISLRPIAAKPIDMRWDEDYEDYEERKKEESKEETKMNEKMNEGMDYSVRLVDMEHARAYLGGGVSDADNGYQNGDTMVDEYNDEEQEQYNLYNGLTPGDYQRPWENAVTAPTYDSWYDSNGNAYYGKRRVVGGTRYMGKSSRPSDNVNQNSLYTNDKLTDEDIAWNRRHKKKVLNLLGIINNGTAEEAMQARLELDKAIAEREERMAKGGGKPKSDGEKSGNDQQRQTYPNNQNQQNNNNGHNPQQNKKNNNGQQQGKKQKQQRFMSRNEMMRTLKPGGSAAQMGSRNNNHNNDASSNSDSDYQPDPQPPCQEEPNPEGEANQQNVESSVEGSIAKDVSAPVAESPADLKASQEEVPDDNDAASTEMYTDKEAKPEAEVKTVEPKPGSINKLPILGSTSKEPEESDIVPMMLVVDGKEMMCNASE